MTTTATAMTAHVPPSPSSAAILAAAQQRRLLLQKAKDPTVLDEFGPLGAPSPTKSSTLAASRRRVMSAAATGTGRPSWEDATANYPLPSSSKSQQLLHQKQQQQQQQPQSQPESQPEFNGNTFPLRPVSNASRNRWEEDWSGNAAAAAMGMTSPAAELIRRSSNASQHLLQQATASSSSSPTNQHQQLRAGQHPTKIPDYAAHRDPQQRRKNLRQSATVSTPSLRMAAAGGSKSSSDSAASIASNAAAAAAPNQNERQSKSPYLLTHPPPVHLSTSSSEMEEEYSQGLRPPVQQSDHLSAARTLHAVNSGGSRSVSAPYVTHDFDEMLPPAVARRIEQQRLMAMDPRLSRIEGLIETWDRDGLPLSAPKDGFERQQRELQQQKLEREQKERQEKEAQRLKAQHKQQQQQQQQATLGVDGGIVSDGQERAAQMRREQIHAQRQQAQQRRQGQEEQDRRQQQQQQQQGRYQAQHSATNGYPPLPPNGSIGTEPGRFGAQSQVVHQEKPYHADNRHDVAASAKHGGTATRAKKQKTEKVEDKVDSGCCCVIM